MRFFSMKIRRGEQFSINHSSHTPSQLLNLKGVWIRVGSTQRRASDEEIKRMMISSVSHLYERQLTQYTDLDFSYTAKLRSHHL